MPTPATTSAKATPAPPPVLTPGVEFILTGFGLGHVKPFPGTWGSLPPVALAIVFLLLSGGVPGVAYHAALIATLIAFTTACATHGDFAEARFHKKDPAEVVADEVAGMTIPLLFLPIGDSALTTLAAVALAFIAFRAFDILKPWPASALQRIPGGWGIVLDDLAAGVYALAAVQIIARLLW